MKRTLALSTLALAAVMGSSAAMAQSSVTVYGRLNTTLESQKVGNVSVKGLFNNASRIGFRGVEDLGGGMKAGFVLEHGFNSDTGAQSQGAFWARQSEVNLSGGFGMIRLGNFTSEAYFATSDYIGMHNHETGSSSDALYAYIGRNSNKFAYRLPDLAKGLQIEASLSMREGSLTAKNNIDIAANYSSGPLALGFGYEKGDGNARQFAVRALYEAGAFVFGGMIQRDRDGWGAGLGNRTNYRGSVAYNFGNNELHLNIGRSGDYSNLANSDATQWTVGFNHNLSKRTKVYTYFTKTSDDAGVYGFGGDFRSLALGVRHNF
jgi:predicted porin